MAPPRAATAPATPVAASSPTRPSAPAPGGGRHRGEAGAWDWGRWRLTPQQTALLALVAALLVATAAWWALRARPHAEPVPLADRQPTAAAGSALAAPPSDSGTSPVSTPAGDVSDSTPTSGGSLLVVDVSGKVRRPGIVELPPGSRVVDALRAAGGARRGVDEVDLNLARPLVDGEQIVVGLDVPSMAPPGSAPTPGTGSASATPISVDLNTATEPELETLPGIGPVTAQAILDYRTQNGPFGSVDELLDVSGIGDATLADLEPYVHV